MFQVAHIHRAKQQRLDRLMVEYRALLRGDNTPDTNQRMVVVMEALGKAEEDVERDLAVIVKTEELLREYEAAQLYTSEAEYAKRRSALAADQDHARVRGGTALAELNGIRDRYRHLFGPSSVVSVPPREVKR